MITGSVVDGEMAMLAEQIASLPAPTSVWVCMRRDTIIGVIQSAIQSNLGPRPVPGQTLYHWSRLLGFLFPQLCALSSTPIVGYLSSTTFLASVWSLQPVRRTQTPLLQPEVMTLKVPVSPRLTLDSFCGRRSSASCRSHQKKGGRKKKKVAAC